MQNNIDLLFAHSSARIVSFSTVTPVQGELLPWTSPTERTIASGMLQFFPGRIGCEEILTDPFVVVDRPHKDLQDHPTRYRVSSVRVCATTSAFKEPVLEC